MKSDKFQLSGGLTLVEMLIAASIILAFLLVLFGINNLYLKTVLLNNTSIKATFLAEEGLEVIRFLRDSSWDNNILPLSVNTDYNLILESNTWKATTTTVVIDNIYRRGVRLSEVYRDSSDDIVSSGGVLDPNTKLVTVTVSWPTGEETATRSISTYLSNILDE